MAGERKKKEYPAEVVARVREMRAVGYSLNEICVALGLTPKVMYRLARRHDIPTRIYRSHPLTGDKDAHRNWCRRRRLKVLAVLGGKCVRCGYTDNRALQIDHINGGGRRDDSRRSLNSFYNDVMAKAGIEYQCLCANCNAIKRWENNEVPKHRGPSRGPSVLAMRQAHPDWPMRRIARELGISGTIVRRHLLKATA